MSEEKSVFETLSAIDCSSKIEKKNGLSYLSWTYAWQELQKIYPDSFYTIYENPDGFNYFTDGNTCWVKTGVTVKGKEIIEYLPVMDFRNKSIKRSEVTSTDVNKAIQRSITKAIARHGLGLYIYAGEDLPESEAENRKRIEDETNDLIAKVGKILEGGKHGWNEKQISYANWCMENRNIEGLEKILSSVVEAEIA